LQALAQRLFESGISGDKPLAIVSQATTPGQKVHVSTISRCKIAPPPHHSPALVVIGEVARLHDKFSWFNPTNEGTEYFESLPPVSLTVQTPGHAPRG
jgi:siroheme synthase